MKRGLRLLIRHPFFPKTPVTILLTLVLLTIFGVSLTFLIIYILNPDKEPLPWRGYCTIPQLSTSPPSLTLPTTAQFPHPLPENFTLPTFPARRLQRPLACGRLRGRLLNGQCGGAEDAHPVLMGKPSAQSRWRRRSSTVAVYNDMIILPISENMNNGKTYEYFHWAARNAWVPPLYHDNFAHFPEGLSYTNATAWFATIPATHDPLAARQDYASGNPMKWVRPDYVVKTDDDSFVMLAELEARLRVELHRDPQEVRLQNGAVTNESFASGNGSSSRPAAGSSGSDSRLGSSGTSASNAMHALVTPTSTYTPL
ncbi:hypothetical protein EVJ58_g8544, partial [Rhodofomes roseus]